MGQRSRDTYRACTIPAITLRCASCTEDWSGLSSRSWLFLVTPMSPRRSSRKSSDPLLGQANMTTRRILASSQPRPSASIRDRNRWATSPPWLWVTITRRSCGIG